MMKMDLYKKAMEVGCLFNKKYSDDCRTEDWNASEEASYFCEKIIKKAEKHKCSVRKSFEKYGDKLIGKIEIKTIFENHMWDEYCKGFLAGQILGYPTEGNMILVDRAERLWEDTDEYGYYQEVLEDVRRGV